MSQEVKINKKNIGVYLLHCLFWLVLILTGYLLSVFSDISFSPLKWAVYIALFYTTYSFLAPVLLITRKIAAFITGSLSAIVVSFILLNLISFINDNLAIKGLHIKLFSLYGLLLVYFASILIRVLVKFRDDENKKEEILKERTSAELLQLKQQVNPHFLFNTLNNIYALSIKNPTIAPHAILKVSSILRHTLYNSNKASVLLKDEIEVIGDYIEFQKMRSKNGLPISFTITGAVNDYIIEPFILLPLVENAFKFGMANMGDSFINISVTIIPGKLEFFISNKKCFMIESGSEHSGIGIRNIKRRLDLVYPERHEFKIIEKDDVFSVFLELPLENEK